MDVQKSAGSVAAAVDGRVEKYMATWHITNDWWLLDVPQTSPLWHIFRHGRITGSVIGTVAGHSNFGTPAEESKYILGLDEKKFTPEQEHNMAVGREREPQARDAYMLQKNRIALEVGLVIPRWESRIGASVDGIVIDPSLVTRSHGKYTNLIEAVDQVQKDYSLIELISMAEGILEIKSPKKMYSPLFRYHQQQNINKGWGVSSCYVGNPLPINLEPDPWSKHYSHIWHTHFDQMQEGMAVLRKPWCDYVVYTPEMMFSQRVSYCHKYYEEKLFRPTYDYLGTTIDPYLRPDRRWALPQPQGPLPQTVKVEYAVRC